MRERYQLERPVRALRRQHQAAQEPRAADRGVPLLRQRARISTNVQAADHRRRDLEVRRRCGAPCTATSCTSTCASSASCRTRRWRCSTGWPRCSCSRRSTKGSACRRSKRWPAARRSITSNVSSLPEVVGDAALLIDPYDAGAIADAMRRVLTDAALRADLRAQRARRARASSRGSARSRASARSTRRCCGEPARAARQRDARLARPRVALVHDWLTGMRGGEKVLEALCELYPDADDLHAAALRGSVSPAHRAASRSATSFVQRLPSAGAALPAATCRSSRPRSSSSTSIAYDLVISTSHCAAKSVVVARPRAAPLLLPLADALRVGPVRRLFRPGAGRAGCVEPLLRPVLARLARWDAATAGRVDRFVANSQYVAGRIRRYYNRGATVVYPPVDTAFYRPDPRRRRRADLPRRVRAGAVQAARRRDRGLPAAGRAAEDRRRRARTRPAAARWPAADVEFLGWLDRRRDSRRCTGARRAVLLPGDEDFGMVPVEAQACGRPVVALGARRRARDAWSTA